MDKTVVLVTGANQGIGLEIVRKIASERKDYQVLLSGRRSEAVSQAVADLRAEGLGNVDPLVLDVCSDASIAAAVRELDARYGRLDVLVNNAGILAEAAGAGSPRDQWAAVFNTNVASVALLTDALLPLMRRSVGTHGPERIVFLSSTRASLARKDDPANWMHPNVSDGTRAYSASKAALNMLALHYMVEFEKDPANWKINCVCPGYVSTKLNGFSGPNTVASGAVRASELAVLDADGPTGTFSDKEGPIPW